MSWWSGLWAPWHCLFLTPQFKYDRGMTRSPDFYMVTGVPKLCMYAGITSPVIEFSLDVTPTLLKLEAMNMPRFPGQKSQESSCLQFSSSGINGTCCYFKLQSGCSGFKPRTLLLHRSHFTCWVVSCAPVNDVFKVSIFFYYQLCIFIGE